MNECPNDRETSNEQVRERPCELEEGMHPGEGGDGGEGGEGGGADDVLVRRIIFAVPSNVDMGGGVVGGRRSPALSAPLNRRSLECGGMSTPLSLPSDVKNVTLEMRGDLSGGVGAAAAAGGREGGDGGTSWGSPGEGEGADFSPYRAVALKDLRANVTVTKAVPWVGWGILATAVLSLCGVGAVVGWYASNSFDPRRLERRLVPKG